MKLNRIALLSAACLSVAIAGCITVPKTTVTETSPGVFTTNTVSSYVVDTNKVDALIDSNVPSAVRIATAKVPQARAIITDIKVGVCALVEAGNVTPADLQSIGAQTKLASLQSDEAQVAANAIFSFYSLAYQDAVTAGLSKNQLVAQFVPILTHLCDAIGVGLGTNPTPMSPTPTGSATFSN